MNRRIKRRVFKRQSDLIKYAVRRANYRKMMEAKEQKRGFMAWFKKHNWLEWCKQKLTRAR